jgi:hypothetical protein
VSLPRPQLTWIHGKKKQIKTMMAALTLIRLSIHLP